MRAVIYERTGPARDVLQIAEVPTPEPDAGEVRVRVGWSGVNPSDVKTRAGLRSRSLPFPRVVPHSDGSGVIDAVGAGVAPSRIGERVWTWNAAWGRAFGTAAQYVVLPAAQAVALPGNVELEAGACLGIPALTAYHAITVDGGVTGRDVLVAGGAGAVGHYAIQFARRTGARTIVATVSSAQKAALARQAGADTVVDYRSEDVEGAIAKATDGRGVDRIVEVDLAANLPLDLKLLTAAGIIVAYGSGAPEIAVPFLPTILKNVGLRFFIVYNLDPVTRQRAIAHLTAMLARGDLVHNIAARLPFERIAEAHEMVEQGRQAGNVVLAVE